MTDSRHDRIPISDGTIALLIGLLAVFIAVMGLTPFHTWGDDFAGYLLQAHAIGAGNIHGEMHLNGVLLAASDAEGAPSAYPWGFPLLLWLGAKLIGWNLVSLKLIGLLSLGAAAALTFLLARSLLTRSLGTVAATVIAFQPRLLRSADALGSDLPFLAFSAAALLLMSRVHRTIEADGKAPAWQPVTAAVLTACGVAMRSNGVLLAGAFLAACGYVWLSAPRLRRAVAVAGGIYSAMLFAVLAPYLGWFPDGNVSRITGVARAHSSLAATLLRRAHETAITVGEFLPFSLLSGNAAATVAAAAAGLIVLVALIAVGTWARRPHSLTLFLFGLFNLGLLLVYPLNDDARYLFPLLLPAAILALAGLQVVSTGLERRISNLRVPSPRNAQIGSWMAATAVLVMIALGCSQAWRPRSYALSGPYAEPTRSVVAFLVRAVPEDARVSFFKPRALRLLTGRQAIKVGRPEHVDRAMYFVIDKRVADGHWERQWQLDPSYFVAESSRFERLFENEQFTVYRSRAVAPTRGVPQ
jgi:hypothetical protein